MHLREITGVMRVTDRMRANALGCKTQMFVLMPPMDFLKLTTKPEWIPMIQDNAHSILQYNRWAKKDEIIVYPFLRIDIFPGGMAKTVAHEGRHRAAALLAKKAPWMPVAIQLRAAGTYEPKMSNPERGWYNSEYRLTSRDLPSFIKGQYDGEFHSRADWKIIKDDVLSGFRRN